MKRGNCIFQEKARGEAFLLGMFGGKKESMQAAGGCSTARGGMGGDIRVLQREYGGCSKKRGSGRENSLLKKKVENRSNRGPPRLRGQHSPAVNKGAGWCLRTSELGMRRGRKKSELSPGLREYGLT